MKARFRLSSVGMLLKKRCSRTCVFLDDRKDLRPHGSAEASGGSSAKAAASLGTAHGRCGSKTGPRPTHRVRMVASDRVAYKSSLRWVFKLILLKIRYSFQMPKTFSSESVTPSIPRPQIPYFLPGFGISS